MAFVWPSRLRTAAEARVVADDPFQDDAATAGEDHAVPGVLAIGAKRA